MMKAAIIPVLMLIWLLSACGERDQALTTKRGLTNHHAWQGAQNGFVAKGWTPGDKISWQNQIRTRGQNQNEYVKTN